MAWLLTQVRVVVMDPYPENTKRWAEAQRQIADLEELRQKHDRRTDLWLSIAKWAGICSILLWALTLVLMAVGR